MSKERSPTIAQEAAGWVFAILVGVCLVALAELSTWMSIWRAVQ